MRRLLLAVLFVVLGGVVTRADGARAASQTAGRAPQSVDGAIAATAQELVGRPYRKAGRSPERGFDAIGLVWYVHATNGIAQPPKLQAFRDAAPLRAMTDLAPGNVVYFQNTLHAGLSHTGIYVGDGRFVHAEWFNTGVVVSALRGDPRDGDYWAEHFAGGNRVR